ncbi:MAG: type II secretion system protein [Planctomycetota bacterium]|nr:type II secretion system protein [Planctomycetota bacterium]
MEKKTTSRGFTMVEILVVLGVITVLIAVLFPALVRSNRAAKKAESMNRMRQIHLWMSIYSGDNGDFILPSQFDYSDPNAFPFSGKVRTVPSSPAGLNLSVGDPSVGTWTDILWTINDLGLNNGEILTIEGDLNLSYRYDSPDKVVYEKLRSGLDSPLRSAGLNSKDFKRLSNIEVDFKPFGSGAQERNLPGFFAANDFFNARPDAPPIPGAVATPINGNWFTNAQIRVPDRAMYLVDSFAGETIAPLDEPYAVEQTRVGDTILVDDPDNRTDEVDFRYNGTCLMLFLDGHVKDQGPWANLTNLQEEFQVNVTNPLASSP